MSWPKRYTHTVTLNPGAPGLERFIRSCRFKTDSDEAERVRALHGVITLVWVINADGRGYIVEVNGREVSRGLFTAEELRP